MAQAVGTFVTPNGGKYIGQLCKHFAHKVETGFDENSGWAKFPMGSADMSATADLLTITLKVDDPEQIGVVKHIIDSHLVTFAFREGFESMNWGEASN